jgi:Uma2 family endonuclease
MTVLEYLQTPESALPRELADGVLRVSDAPRVPHQRAVARFFLALNQHATDEAIGEVWLSPIDVILDDEQHLVVQPDLLFISNARSRIVTDRIWGAPDLVVEVLSPNPRIGTLNEHLRWFATYGVRECWIVDLAIHNVEVVAFADSVIRERRRFEAASPIRSRVFPEFNRSLATILGS